MSMSPIPRKPSSPFDQIKHVKEGHDYWSARELQHLLDYTEWRNFEETIERAMIACKNSGHLPSDHFVGFNKMIDLGKRARRRVEDYQLTRYACYLVAMNSDPRKETVSQAQTYFALQTRAAELASLSSVPITQDPQQTNIHVVTDALRARAMANLAAVPEGYFSVSGELFKHLYNLEAMLKHTIDNAAMIEVSVGQCWSTYARDTLEIADRARQQYPHRTEQGRIVYPWAYPIRYENTFAVWLWDDYFPQHFPAYQQYRKRFIAQQRAMQKRD